MLPIFAIAACGVLLSSYFSFPLLALFVAMSVCGLVAAALRKAKLAALLLLLAAMTVTELRMDAPVPPADEPCFFRLRIPEEPVRRRNHAVAEAKVEAWCDDTGRWRASQSRVRLICDSTWCARAGELLYAQGRIRQFSTLNPLYAKSMQRRGYAGRLHLGERDLLKRDTVGRRLSLGVRLHAAALGRLERLELNPQSRAVVEAMALGERRGLTSELRKAYARGGSSHLLAVSGLHVGVVFLSVNALLWLLPLVRGGHRLRNVAVVLIVWLYALAAGCSPSVLRAAILFSALQLALAFRLDYGGLNLLFGAAAVAIMIHPPLIFDISFQLSFLAVNAILCWAVPIIRHLGGRFARWIAGTLIVGLCATAATLPLISHQFGIVSAGGILLNPAVILTAQVIVSLAIVSLCLPAGWALVPVEKAIDGAARLQNGLVEAVASWDCAAFDCRLSTGEVIAIYAVFCLVTLVAWSVERKKSVSLLRRKESS